MAVHAHFFSAWITPEMAKGIHRRTHHLAAAPLQRWCFVWSYLTDGDPVYTLVQVAVNESHHARRVRAIVMFLCGVANMVVPPNAITSVVVSL